MGVEYTPEWPISEVVTVPKKTNTTPLRETIGTDVPLLVSRRQKSEAPDLVARHLP